MLKIQSTVIPKKRLTRPYTNVSMGYINDYWTQPGNHFNYELYLKILRVKKENF